MYYLLQEAGRLVEIIYNDFANASLRRAITEEFYGKSFRVFKVNIVLFIGLAGFLVVSVLSY